MKESMVKCKNCRGKGFVYAPIRDEKGKEMGQRSAKCYYCKGIGLRPRNFRKCPHLFEFVKTTDNLGKDIEVRKCKICVLVEGRF